MARLPGPRSPVEQARWGVAFSRDLYGSVVALHDRYGPVVDLGMGRLRYVYLFGPEANEHLLSTDPGGFLWRDAFEVLVPINGDTALVVTDGDEHDRRRRIVQPAFGRRRIDAYLQLMVDEVDRVIDRWSAGATVDAHADFRLATRRIVVLALFGEHLRDRADELGDLLQGALEFVSLPIVRQQVRADLPFTRFGRAMRARRRADEIVYAEIARRRAEVASGVGGGAPAHRVGGDVLDMLLAAGSSGGDGSDGADAGACPVDHGGDADGRGLTDVELRDQVVSLVAAGYDTTSAAVGWAVHELATRPEVWHRAAAEVADVVGDGELTPGHVPRLAYLDGVIREVLRLHAAAVVGRRCVRDTELYGHTIPAGRMVLYSPYVTHRMPDLWPEPLAFRPGRWIPGDPAHREPVPFSWTPFGGGYRRCIGFAFAGLEITAALVRLLQRTRLAPVRPDIPATGVAANAPEGGVPMRIVDVRPAGSLLTG